MIDELPTALVFAWSWTDPADDGGKGVAFLDHLNGAMILAQGDLTDVFTDVDPGRARPLAGSGALVGLVLLQDAPGNR